MDFTSLPLGNARHIIAIRVDDDSVIPLCMPATVFPIDLVEGDEKHVCSRCTATLVDLFAKHVASVSSFRGPYVPQGGDILVMANPGEGEATDDVVNDRLDALNKQRAIRVSWWKRLLDILHLR